MASASMWVTKRGLGFRHVHVATEIQAPTPPYKSSQKQNVCYLHVHAISSTRACATLGHIAAQEAHCRSLHRRSHPDVGSLPRCMASQVRFLAVPAYLFPYIPTISKVGVKPFLRPFWFLQDFTSKIQALRTIYMLVL